MAILQLDRGLTLQNYSSDDSLERKQFKYVGSILYNCHLDRLSYVSSVLPRGKNSKILKKCLVYRGHLLWNELPLEIRGIRCQTTFKFRVKQHLWTLTFSEFSNTELDLSLSDGINQFLWPIWAHKSQYGLEIWALSYGHNRQVLIKGWVGVRGVSILKFYW